MKKRNIVNLIAEIAAWIVVAVLLYGVFKIVDPIKRYNITWFDKDDKITQVETPEAKEEKVETTEKKEVQSTSRFKVEYESRTATGGDAGLYVVTDKATGQKYIGLSGIALTPLK